MRYGCRDTLYDRGRRLTRKGQNRDIGRCQHGNFGMARALVGRGVLLKAAIAIDRLAAMTIVTHMRECHRRRECRRNTSGRGVDHLGEQHHPDEHAAQRNTQMTKRATHVARTSP